MPDFSSACVYSQNLYLYLRIVCILAHPPGIRRGRYPIDGRGCADQEWQGGDHDAEGELPDPWESRRLMWFESITWPVRPIKRCIYFNDDRLWQKDFSHGQRRQAGRELHIALLREEEGGGTRTLSSTNREPEWYETFIWSWLTLCSCTL